MEFARQGALKFCIFFFSFTAEIKISCQENFDLKILFIIQQPCIASLYKATSVCKVLQFAEVLFKISLTCYCPKIKSYVLNLSAFDLTKLLPLVCRHNSPKYLQKVFKIKICVTSHCSSFQRCPDSAQLDSVLPRKRAALLSAVLENAQLHSALPLKTPSLTQRCPLKRPASLSAVLESVQLDSALRRKTLDSELPIKTPSLTQRCPRKRPALLSTAH